MSIVELRSRLTDAQRTRYRMRESDFPEDTIVALVTEAIAMDTRVELLERRTKVSK